MSFIDIVPFLPLLIMIVSGIAILLLEVFLKPDQKKYIHYFAPFGIVAAGFATLYLFKLVSASKASMLRPLEGFFQIDHFSIYFYLLFLLIGFVVILMSSFYLEREKLAVGEYYALLLFSLSGLMLLASSTDLITLFIGLEILSMSVYVLVGYNRNSERSNEAAFKYFLLGSMASAILLYGIALTYGTTQSTHLLDIQQYFLTHANFGLSGIGMLLMLTGLSFKVAAVPFHSWSPDAYEGAPMPITCFMATAVKAGAFALMLRVFGEGFIALKAYWIELFIILAALTMLTGNILAFTQKNIKRMLAYASIVHTGYLLVAFTALSPSENAILPAILYYLFIYVLTTLGLFTLLSHLASQGEKHQNISDFSGLYHSHPYTAALIAIFMLSFIGVPPMGGFFAKYYLFSHALSGKQTLLVLFALINSILSIYYYLRVVIVIYFKPQAEHWKSIEARPASLSLIASLTGIAVFWAGFGPFNLLGIFPSLPVLIKWMELARLY